MTSPKLFKVAAELATIADTLPELRVQSVELIVQETHYHEVHCLRKVQQNQLDSGHSSKT